MKHLARGPVGCLLHRTKGAEGADFWAKPDGTLLRADAAAEVKLGIWDWPSTAAGDPAQ
ncbi:hypothetical protein GCM10010388_73820 [Streptomyces mauvecolor]